MSYPGLQIDRLMILRTMLRSWIESQKDYKGNGPHGEFVKTVRARLDGDDLIGAALCFVDRKTPIPLIGSVDRSLKEERTILRLVFTTEEGRRVLLKENASPTFRLGGAAHFLMESLVLSGGNLESIRDKKIELEKSGDGKVTGIFIADAEIIKDKNDEIKVKNINTKSSDQLSFTQTLDSKKPRLVLSGDLLSRPVLKVSFTEPLDAPKPDESMIEWIKGIFFESFRTIAYCNGGLPSKPSDVEKIFDEDTARSALMRSLEAAHILFGVQSHLSLVDWGKGNTGNISYEKVDMFAVLNWLAIIRKGLELEVVRSASEDGLADYLRSL